MHRQAANGRALRLRQALLLAVVFARHASAGTDWLPLDPADLAMTSEPNAPGAPAICLYRQVDRDDIASTERDYVRIKVLGEAGRRQANVQLAYLKWREDIQGIEARTIQPDGTVIPFDGVVYEKPVVSVRGQSLLAKAFTLPDVGVGSVIEYRYIHKLHADLVFDSNWMLSDELYTRLARYTLKPSPWFPVTWAAPVGVPPGTVGPKSDDGVISLEMHDVPAFAVEDHMPPADALRQRVEFIYRLQSKGELDPDRYWQTYGRAIWQAFNRFTDVRRPMARALAAIVPPGATPGQALRRIYERVQQVRNLDFERERDDQEQDRDRLRDREDAADVLEYGYGTSTQVNWLFCALARAAGLRADPVYVGTRDRVIVDRHRINPRDLNADVVVVALDGKDLYLDPGMPLAPYGELPWEATGVAGLRIARDDSQWVVTPATSFDGARVQRRALLGLEADGALRGTLTVTWTGLDALERRRAMLREDEVRRRTFLEDEIRAAVPHGIEVRLTSSPAWGGNAEPLVAQFSLAVPAWGTRAGSRLLVPAGLFGNAERHLFEHAGRIYPVYFSYPNATSDSVTIRLRDGFEVDNLPADAEFESGAFTFRATTESDGGYLVFSRELSIRAAITPAGAYPEVQAFFGKVRMADDGQAVLRPEVQSR